MTEIYDKVVQRSLVDPEGFWGEVAQGLDWEKKWDTVLDDSNPPFYRWFKGGELNSCYNALDRHVENGRSDQLALIYDSPVTQTIQKYTYAELLDQVRPQECSVVHQHVEPTEAFARGSQHGTGDRTTTGRQNSSVYPERVSLHAGFDE